MSKSIAIGIDIGGSHISCAAVDLAAKRYLPETLAESALNNHAGANEIIGIWVKTIEEAIQKTNAAEIAGIGFAMPGPFDYARGIALFDEGVQKYENLYGLNVAQAIRKQMNLPQDFPIRFINDATAFAIAEDWIGKSAGTSRSFAITLGTGFGSAFLRNRMPVVSGDEVPAMGYVYHLPFEDGNADDYFSTRGLLKRYEMQTDRKLSGVKELALQAERNQIALRLFTDFGFKLGVFLKPWLQKFEVEVLVIGGNISNAFDLFGHSLLEYLKENSIPARVEISELKETAAMIGSAVLFEEQFYDQLANN